MPHPYATHAPGHVRDAFLEAVSSFLAWTPGEPEPMVAVEVDYEPRRVPLRSLCRQLRNCRDVLPSTEFNQLAADLPMERQTYGEAARAMHDYIEARSR